MTTLLLPPIERVHAELDLTYLEIARALGVNESTVHRWRSGGERVRASAGALGIASLTRLLDALDVRWHGDRARAVEWLNAPNACCNGENPRAWIIKGRADFIAGVIAGEQHAQATLPPIEPEYHDLAARFEMAPVGMAQVTLTGEFFAVNRRLTEVLGYAEDGLIGRRFQDITHPDDLAGDLDFALKLLSGAIPSYTMQKRYRRGDGRMIWCRLAGSLMRDGVGAPRHFLAAIDPLPDIEAAAIRLALGQAPGAEDAREGVWEWDVSSGEVHWSPQIARTLGRKSEEIPGTFEGFAELLHPDDLPRTSEAIEDYIAGRAPRYDIQFRMRHANGSWRWVHSRGRALARDIDGRPQRLAGLHSDITEQRDAEERLRASHAELATSSARYRALLESSSQIIWSTTADGRYADSNPAWEQFTGQTPEASRTYGWSRVIHPDEAERTIAEWVAAVAAERPFEMVSRVRRHDGVYRTMEVRAVPVRDTAGRIIEWVGMNTDITDRADTARSAGA